jgi:hypothetical protein
VQIGTQNVDIVRIQHLKLQGRIQQGRKSQFILKFKSPPLIPPFVISIIVGGITNPSLHIEDTVTRTFFIKFGALGMSRNSSAIKQQTPPPRRSTIPLPASKMSDGGLKLGDKQLVRSVVCPSIEYDNVRLVVLQGLGQVFQMIGAPKDQFPFAVIFAG